MGQNDILQFLKKYPNEEFTAKQLSKYLNISPSCISISCGKLRRSSEVEFRMEKNDGFHNLYIYKHKNK
jgi:hypothetical protein